MLIVPAVALIVLGSTGMVKAALVARRPLERLRDDHRPARARRADEPAERLHRSPARPRRARRRPRHRDAREQHDQPHRRHPRPGAVRRDRDGKPRASSFDLAWLGGMTARDAARARRASRARAEGGRCCSSRLRRVRRRPPRARLERPRPPSRLGGDGALPPYRGRRAGPEHRSRRSASIRACSRRERRALLQARDERLRDLGGLTVEMYRRSAWRDDLLHERCAEVIGIDARLAEIDELLHGSEGTDGASAAPPVLRGSHFCPNCGRVLNEGTLDDPLLGRHERSTTPDRALAGTTSGEAAGGRGRRRATTCPRCGAARAPEQDYCLECGLRLPVVVGTVAALRRGWVRRHRLVSRRLGLARARGARRRLGRRGRRDRARSKARRGRAR